MYFKQICQTLQFAVYFPESEYWPVRFAGLVRRVGSGLRCKLRSRNTFIQSKRNGNRLLNLKVSNFFNCRLKFFAWNSNFLIWFVIGSDRILNKFCLVKNRTTKTRNSNVIFNDVYLCFKSLLKFLPSWGGRERSWILYKHELQYKRLRR